MECCLALPEWPMSFLCNICLVKMCCNFLKKCIFIYLFLAWMPDSLSTKRLVTGNHWLHEPHALKRVFTNTPYRSTGKAHWLLMPHSSNIISNVSFIFWLVCDKGSLRTLGTTFSFWPVKWAVILMRASVQSDQQLVVN